MVDKSAFTVTKLYRDCLRLADYVGTKGGNAAIIKKQVQQQFQRNATETDPTKVRDFDCGGRSLRKFAWTSCPLSTAVMQIVEQKDAAIRGLSNYMFMEAQRMAKEGVSSSPTDKFDG
ncbi:TPA: hypothetical protein ACH3X2_001566 [Trebouxia sp. C0005]